MHLLYTFNSFSSLRATSKISANTDRLCGGLNYCLQSNLHTVPSCLRRTLHNTNKKTQHKTLRVPSCTGRKRYVLCRKTSTFILIHIRQSDRDERIEDMWLVNKWNTISSFNFAERTMTVLHYYEEKFSNDTQSALLPTCAN